MLVFHQISQHYGHQRMFQQLSLTLTAPRVLITGANGSGKTTLLLMAAGLIKPMAGHIEFRQQNVWLPATKRLIGISANKVELPPFLTVQELLQFQARQFNGPAATVATHWIDALGLTPFLRTKVGDLSLGNAKKLSLILALQHQPELLLLDEPSNGLDETSRGVLAQLLQTYPGQIIIASHDELAAGDLPVQHLPLSTLLGVAP